MAGALWERRRATPCDPAEARPGGWERRPRGVAKGRGLGEGPGRHRRTRVQTSPSRSFFRAPLLGLPHPPRAEEKCAGG